MTQIIAVVSHKGGTGKTSLVQNVGYELSKRGRVLLVDFDPQANLTMGCGVDPEKVEWSVFDALRDSADASPAIIRQDHYDLLPSELDLALSEQQFATHADRNNKLQDALRRVQSRYNFVLIDTPPNLGFFAFNTLTAASEVIVPLQCQPYSLRAVSNTLRLINTFRKTKKTLKLSAIVLTMHDRRVALTKSIETAARANLAPFVARTVIPVNVSIAEASLTGKPVALYASRSRGATAYYRLANELYG